MTVTVKRDTLQSDQIGLLLISEWEPEGTQQFVACAKDIDLWGDHKCLKDNEKVITRM
jgi:hypothetical protein